MANMCSIEKTDWNRYYSKPFPTALCLRRITSGRLVRALKKCSCFSSEQPPLQVLEFGGGNSSFAHAVTTNFSCDRYVVADTNAAGVELFKQQKLKSNLLLQVLASMVLLMKNFMESLTMQFVCSLSPLNSLKTVRDMNFVLS